MAKPQEALTPVPGEEAAKTESGEALMIDLSGVGEEAARPVVSRGIHNVFVESLDFGYSQSAGNPMWTWRLELDDSEGEQAGMRVYFHTPFVENMMPRVKKTISHVMPELLEKPFDPQKIAESGVMLGLRCRARIDVKPYQGKPSNNVRELLPAADEDGGAFLAA